jgi:ABC-type Fe3+ transport system substrate-binding protein
MRRATLLVHAQRCLSIAGAILMAIEVAYAAEAKHDWQSQWQKLVTAGKRESQVGIVAEETYLPVIEEFRKKYPGINISQLGGPSGAERAQKLMAERRADQYLRDIYIGGPASARFGEATYQVFEPIRPALILPEVLDVSKWWRGKHHYSDDKGQYIFVYEGSVRAGNIIYNKNLVNPQEITSYWDLLNPKWRGKIVATDAGPRPAGGIQDGLRLFYYHPDLGSRFLRKLYGEMDVTLSRNQTQILDWVAVGKFALAFFTVGTEAENAIRQGVGIGKFAPGNFKEGGIVNATVGAVSLLNRAAHPNAARVFLNWLLSREGQIVFQNTFVPSSAGEQGNSMREDISKDIVPAGYRREAGQKYLQVTPEMLDTVPIADLINETLAKAKK